MEPTTLSGAELAELLHVTPSALSRAANHEYFCAEEPVFDWAVRSASGRIIGYDVPDIDLEMLFENDLQSGYAVDEPDYPETTVDIALTDPVHESSELVPDDLTAETEATQEAAPSGGGSFWDTFFAVVGGVGIGLIASNWKSS